MTDRELLDQLSRDRSEAAFTELVRRHIDLVHSAALRQLGDADAARDITQNVFLLLTREAGLLPAAVILSGWLYRTTRNLCLETLRRDRRRREREHTAAEQLMNDATANPWEQVAPALEPAMDELGETDRQAILLRYFENKSLREVGVALGLGEDAAQKRVSRALDRLRDIFSRRGVSLSATALAGSLAAGAVQAAPAGLAVTISTAALGGAAVATVTTLATEGASTAMNLINLKTAAAILGAAAVTGTATYVVQEREAEQLRTENTTLNQTHAKLASDQQEALAMIQLRDEQIELLKRDVGDLPRLRGEVDRLNRMVEELAQLNSRTQQLAAREKAELDEANSRSDQAWKLGERKRLSQLSYAGRNTPEAALESVLWASRESHWKELLDSIDLSAEVVAEQTANGTIDQFAHSIAGALYSLVRTTSVSATGSPETDLVLRGERGTAAVNTFVGGVFPGQPPAREPEDTYDGALELLLVPVNSEGHEVERGVSFYLREFEDGWKVIMPRANLPR